VLSQDVTSVYLLDDGEDDENYKNDDCCNCARVHITLEVGLLDWLTGTRWNIRGVVVEVASSIN
jgi:hypothetical protein